MARVVRKVSGKAVRGQKKNKGLINSKRFWIICITALIVIIGAGIAIGVVVSNNNKSEDEITVDDYFGMTQIHTEAGVEHEISFEKMSYSGVRMHANPNYDDSFVEYMFVFAVDLSAFYPVDLYDNDDNNLKNNTHAEIFKALKKLQYEIDLYNSTKEGDEDVKLYIVDTTAANYSENTSILADPNFGGSEDTSSTIMFSLITEDGFIDSYSGYKGDQYRDDIKLSATSFSVSDFQTAVNNSINFMKLGFKDQEK